MSGSLLGLESCSAPAATRRAQVFSKDETGMLRTWGPRANIQAVNQQARLAAAQLLGQLAVLRLHQVGTPHLLCYGNYKPLR